MDRLVLRRLAVGQFYGFPQPALADARLGPGLTVVVGGNGAGKTTLVRAAQGVLWPDALRGCRPQVDAEFSLGDVAWRARLDGEQALYWADGRPADRPGLPDALVRDRFALSLADLVSAADFGAPFADAIRRDAAGGVDLRAARHALGFAPHPPEPRALLRAALDAERAVRERRAELEALRRDEDRLAEIAARAQAAAEAVHEVALCDALAERAAARGAADAARAAADAFPAPMAHVAPDTQTRYDGLCGRVEAAEARLAAAERAADDARQALAAHGWPEAAPDPARVAALARQADEAARAALDAETAAAAARRREAAARAELGPLGPATPVPADAFAALAEACRSAAAERAAAGALQTQISALKTRRNAIPRHAASADDLTRGIAELRTWLAFGHAATSAPPPVDARPVWAAAGVCAVLAVAAGVLWHPAALLLLAGALGLAGVAVRLGRAVPAAENPAERARRTYGALPLEGPAAWDEAHVESLLGGLERHLVRRAEIDLWQDAITQAEHAAAERADSVAAAERALAEHAAALGLKAPRAPEELRALAKALLDWRDDVRDLEAAEGRAEAARAQAAAALAAVGDALADVPVDAPADAAGATAAAEALRAGLAARTRLADALAAAEAARDAAAADLDAARADLDAALAHLGLDARDDDAVGALCASFEAFHAAREAHAAAEALAADADRRARALPAFAEADADLDAAALAERHAAAARLAASRDALLDEHARIAERLDAARADHALETAAAEHARALDALEARLDDAADAVVGDALADWLDEETRDAHLPHVFRRARELFADVTAHRYRLEIDGDGFAAFDTARERVFALDALSCGTRVQLLVAVRLAFAEAQEAGVLLPLVLDEALATSDDERAEAIALAVLRLCAAGRQVIAATSQAADVARWERLAAAVPEVHLTVLRLPGTPAAAAHADALPEPATTRRLPDAAGMTPEAFAVATGAPAWTARDPLGALPVALLADDAETARALLDAGFETWGPLEAALRRGAAVPEGTEAVVRAARGVRAWRDAWLVGRGRPVTRAALADSGCVSDAFLDAFAELAAAADGSARALLDALRAGAVPYVRAARVDDLERYLAAHDHLPAEEPVAPADLRRAVAEAVGEGHRAAALAVLDRLRRYAAAHVRPDPSAGETFGDGLGLTVDAVLG